MHPIRNTSSYHYQRLEQEDELKLVPIPLNKRENKGITFLELMGKGSISKASPCSPYAFKVMEYLSLRDAAQLSRALNLTIPNEEEGFRVQITKDAIVDAQKEKQNLALETLQKIIRIRDTFINTGITKIVIQNMGQPGCSNNDLACLKQLKNLKSIALYLAGYDSITIELFEKFPEEMKAQIETLNLVLEKIPSLQWLHNEKEGKTYFPNLKWLRLSQGSWSNWMYPPEQFQWIPSSVTSLSLNDPIRDEHLFHLRHLKLELFVSTRSHITNNGLKLLNPEMKTLVLEDCAGLNLRDPNGVPFPPNLESLQLVPGWLDSRPLPKAFFEHFPRTLKELGLFDFRNHRGLTSLLPDFPSLKVMQLNKHEYNPEPLRALPPSVEELHLWLPKGSSSLKRKAAALSKRFPRLQKITIHCGTKTDYDANELRKVPTFDLEYVLPDRVRKFLGIDGI